MSAENRVPDNTPQAMADADLAEVCGGYTICYDPQTDGYCHWEGSGGGDTKHLCPRCKRPFHFGTWLRFHCNPCDPSWLDESYLLPNIAAGEWKQISKEEHGSINRGSGHR